MTWSPDQQLRLQNLLNGVETRPSIHNRVRAHERHDMPPEVAEVDMTFDDVVDIVNPLHHIPVVGTGYRAVTGDTISPHAQMIGGVLYGGPTGMFNAGLQAAIRQETGHNVDGLVLAMVTGEDIGAHPDAPDLDAPGPQYADARARPAAEADPPAAEPAEIRQTPVPQAPAVALGPARADTAPAAPVHHPMVAEAPPQPAVATAPADTGPAQPAGGSVPDRLPASLMAWPTAPGAIGAGMPTARMPDVSAPATAGDGPQVVLAPTAGTTPARTGSPGQPVEISTALDAALMSLANGAAAPGALASAAPADDNAERTRVAETAYRRSAGAVANY